MLSIGSSFVLCLVLTLPYFKTKTFSKAWIYQELSKKEMKSMLVDENLVNYYIGLIRSCCFWDLKECKSYNTRIIIQGTGP